MVPWPRLQLPEALQGLTVRHLAVAAVCAAALVAAVLLARRMATRRALAGRQAYALLPTDRFAPSLEEIVGYGKPLTRVRRAVGGWWTRRAGAVRIRLDSTASGGMLYSLAGPGWARSVLETPGYAEVASCAMAALDPAAVTPRGVAGPAAEPGDPSEPVAASRPGAEADLDLDDVLGLLRGDDRAPDAHDTSPPHGRADAGSTS